MTRFVSAWDPQSQTAQSRRTAMLARIDALRTLERRAADASAKAAPVFQRRGQLLPRERIALLLDPGAPWLPLATLAGWLRDTSDPERSVPGAGILAGIGVVCGVRCMIVASDSGIDAGAIQAMGLDKALRAQEIALENRLPFLHLVESAGANLMRYRVEGFVAGGALFRNLARHSAAGLPVITVQHGSGTAGGAYMPGLSDVVILVRGRSRAFLAGPPLLKAATGEVATEEELGGAEMHATVSGLGEHLAEDDRHAIALAREAVAALGWPKAIASGDAPAPAYEPDELLGLMPADLRQAVDMHEVIARLADDSDLLAFKPLYGAATLAVQARLDGQPVGFVANNGPIDVAGANKATHFIQRCCQLGHPIVYLQNTTGYIVGRDSEQAGMIKHGSKMIQAVSCATVPQLTVQCGASYGAGNYGMCGRAYAPRFLFSWPLARTAVMGAEQAAQTMRLVAEQAAARKGVAPDASALDAQDARIVELFERQADAFYTSGLLLDDGIIDPRDTRAVLVECLRICREAEACRPRAMQFGVARM
ncbi:MAG TPA: carboxyl transferase domain-containing protein [Albitalea sp.]